MFIHALCQLGDRRGLELALDDPLLMWELAVYLPVERAGVFPNRGLKLNRIDDGLRLSQWYLEHRDQLVWDEDARSFVLTN